jgi:hypothetical protein
MFNLPIFESFYSVITAIISGLIFGFLLRKALVSRFNTIVSQLLLKDFTVIKVIFTAIVVGSIGIYFFNFFNLVKIDVSSTSFPAVILGGAIFGIGMAISGYCPGTAIAALADGSKDMRFGVLGMIFGAMIYARIYPLISKMMTLTASKPMPTFDKLLNISPWFIIGFLIVFALGLFYLIDTKFNKKNDRS